MRLVFVTASLALIQMPAELRRAAGRNRAAHPPVLRRQRMLDRVIRQADAQDLGYGVAGLGGRGARLR